VHWTDRPTEILADENSIGRILSPMPPVQLEVCASKSAIPFWERHTGFVRSAECAMINSYFTGTTLFHARDTQQPVYGGSFLVRDTPASREEKTIAEASID
jgi:hypothetical protein